jgi:hypothetical protein
VSKQLGQVLFQSLCNCLDIYERDISDTSFNAAIVRSVQTAPLSCLFLIDLLLLAYTTDRAAKPGADIEWHRARYWRHIADAYTLDESHLS